MLFDMFSSVDFGNNGYSLLFKMSWFLGIMYLFFFIISFYPQSGLYKNVYLVLRGIMFNYLNLSSVLRYFMFSVFIFMIFFFVIGFNTWGLFPYVYGVSTQTLLVFEMSLCLYFGIFFCGVLLKMFCFLEHLVPQGSPVVLSGFLTYMELMSSLIRPITLSLRLSINVTTGHVLVGLLGTSFIFSFFYSYLISVFVMGILVVYFLFEVFMGYMQSVVYYSLNYEYISEFVDVTEYSNFNSNEVLFFSMLI